MENSTSVSYNIYDNLLNGNAMTSINEDFWLESSSIYGGNNFNTLSADKNWLEREFRSYLKAVTSEWKNAFLQTLISELNNSKIKDHLFEKHIKKIKILSKQLLEKFPKWDFISLDIDELIEDITAYVNNTVSNELEISKNDVQDKIVVIYPKIKWLGKTNVLLTLFYDLLNGQDGKAPLIEANKNDIKLFLKDNFLDSEGNKLSESTIITLFTPSKEDKRANRGDRIELKNVQLK